MKNQAKDFIASADSRTKGILAVACIYVIVLLATVSTGAVEHLTNYVPTVDVKVKDGLTGEKEYLVKQDTVSHVLDEVNIQLNEGDVLNKDLNVLVNDRDYLKITRIETKTITKTESIPFRTITKGKSGWTKTITQEGKKGKLEKTYLIKYANK